MSKEYNAISDEFQSRLNRLKPNDSISVCIVIKTDPKTKDFASKLSEKYKDRHLKMTPELLEGLESEIEKDPRIRQDIRQEVIKEKRKYYIQAMQPILEYLKAQDKVSEKNYNTNTLGGTICAHLSKSQIYELTEVKNVEIIMENQKVHALSN